MFTKKARQATVTPACAVHAVAVTAEQTASHKQQIQTECPPKTLSSPPIASAQFDQYPDCAYVRQPVVLALFGFSQATLWRRVKNSQLPAPKKIGGGRISAWNVGQLRACLDNLQSSGQFGSKEGNE